MINRYNFNKKYFHLFAVIIITSVSYMFYAYSSGITGRTKKNGEGCTCHDINPNSAVNVKVVGPTQVYKDSSYTYQIKISGGSAVRAGTNIAVLRGIINPISPLQKIGDELTHTSPQNFVNDTVAFSFSYKAPSTIGKDTIYANGNSVNFDATNNGDTWNYALNFAINVIDFVPVELSSFSAEVKNNNVALEWITITEKNNIGFVIQRLTINRQKSEISLSNETVGSEESEWLNIGSVEGKGNSTEINKYFFSDINLENGFYKYRLIQTDYDGTKEYFNLKNEVEINIPSSTILFQNYPNPFNPKTKIKYQIAKRDFVTLKVFDILGNEIAVIVNEFKEPGNYEVEFLNAEIGHPDKSGQVSSSLPSGVYLYQIRTGNFILTKKFILMK